MYQNYHKFTLRHIVRNSSTTSTHNPLTVHLATPQKADSLFPQFMDCVCNSKYCTFVVPTEVCFVIGLPFDEREQLSSGESHANGLPLTLFGRPLMLICSCFTISWPLCRQMLCSFLVSFYSNRYDLVL
jgi:hypothetical protein